MYTSTLINESLGCLTVRSSARVVKILMGGMVQLFMLTLGGMVNILVREWFTLKCFMGYGVVFRGNIIVFRGYAITACKISKLFLGSMPSDPPRAFLVSQSASNLFCRKKYA